MVHRLGQSLTQPAVLLVQLLLVAPGLVSAWGSSSSSSAYTNYADSFDRDWLYDGSYVSMKLDGCVWGYVYDNEEVGCMEDESEDGTTYWYQMSNCRRAQAAFSLYSSGSSGNCNSGNFKESFVTTVGLSEFIGWLQEYDQNSPFLYDDDGNDDGGYGWNPDELPVCEEAEDGYYGLACNSDGTFSINYFDDAYCLSSKGVLDSLSTLNNKLKTYSNCQGLTSTGDGGGGDGDGDGDAGSLAENLVYYASSCSNLDSSLCTDDANMQARRSSAGSGGKRHSSSSKSHKSWTTNIKYLMGGLLLVASFIMFTGILFTNRRRRRALMQRKFRQSKRSKSKSGRSKSRDGRSRSGKSRSKSKSRQSDSGVMT